MIKLVVIDFDDTLSLTEEACFHLENETARQLGFAPMTREAHLKNWGKVLEEAIVERIPGIDPKEFMKRIEVVHQQFIQEKRIDGITDANMAFLDAVKDSGRRLAILTSRSLQEVKHLLEKDHPINSRIEKFYNKDNSEYLKPDPRVFDKVISDFSIKPEEAVYLGDTLGDGISAKSAGLHFIAVLESGIRTREDFESVAVDFFATTLPEAFNYISTN
jgi:HAD superfamily hydrolase (TIGR01549 family)